MSSLNHLPSSKRTNKIKGIKEFLNERTNRPWAHTRIVVEFKWFFWMFLSNKRRDLSADIGSV